MSGSNAIATLVATWFGCGYSRIAPGTIGSLGSLPLYCLMRQWPPSRFWVVTAVLCIVGTWAAQHLSVQWGEKDPRQIVIDEVTGTLIALGCVQGGGLVVEVLAVVVFRILDIYKPGPIGWAERAKPPGLGIMADDWVAGALAGVVCWTALSAHSG